MMVSTPISEMATPTHCEARKRCPRKAQEIAMIITGAKELRMELLTAVAYLRPVYEARLQNVVPSTPSASMTGQERRIAGQPRTRCGQAKGSSRTLAMTQRQKASEYEGTSPRNARPATQLSAQDRMAAASSR